MGLMLLGLVLWADAHLFKRLMPGARERMGDRGRALIALTLAVSIVLMVIGYRMADGPVWWGASAATKGINNLMVLVAIYLFAASGMKTRVGTRLRHPQLTGVALWAAGHLLVNGDLPSVVLFGVLLGWSLVEMLLINWQDRDWAPVTAPLQPRLEVMAAAGALITYLVMGLVHAWIGPNPFGA